MVAAGTPHMGSVSLALELDVPLIAVGGPAGIVYPDVADRVGAELVLPEDFAVANAVGAASGFVVARAQIEVQLERPGSFRVVGRGSSSRYDDGEEAIVAAVDQARQDAEAALREQMDGLEGGPVSEHLDVVRHEDPNDPETGLYGANVRIELRRRPIRPRG